MIIKNLPKPFESSEVFESYHKPFSGVQCDPHDAPEWTADQLARAELAEGGKALRPAQGTLARGRGRPKVANPKEQVFVRLDPDVLAALRRSGPGWQVRMNEALRKVLGL